MRAESHVCRRDERIRVQVWVRFAVGEEACEERGGGGERDGGAGYVAVGGEGFGNHFGGELVGEVGGGRLVVYRK